MELRQFYPKNSTKNRVCCEIASKQITVLEEFQRPQKVILPVFGSQQNKVPQALLKGLFFLLLDALIISFYFVHFCLSVEGLEAINYRFLPRVRRLSEPSNTKNSCQHYEGYRWWPVHCEQIRKTNISYPHVLDFSAIT